MKHGVYKTQKEFKDPQLYIAGSDAWISARLRRKAWGFQAPKYENADQLQEMVDNYFLWLGKNPLESKEVLSYKGHGKLFAKPHKRVATLKTLCAYLDIANSTWNDWQDPEHTNYRPDLLEVCERARERVYSDKFEGAVAGLYDSRLITRDLGLIEKKEVSGSMTVNIDKDDGEL